MAQSDETLLQHWRDGDAAAATELLERHTPALARFLGRRVPDDVAEDLLQDTFEACLKTSGPGGTVGFRAYAIGIARHKLLMHFRKSGRLVSDGGGPEPPAPTTAGVVTRVGRHERQAALLRAVAKLSPELQEVLELYYWENLTQVEIAAVVEVPEGTVKSRLFRARKQLADSMAPGDGDEDTAAWLSARDRQER